jgi:hypothetical protein
VAWRPPPQRCVPCKASWSDNMDNETASVEELRAAVREYLAASARLYASATVEAERAKEFLMSAETALAKFTLIVKEIGVE